MFVVDCIGKSGGLELFWNCIVDVSILFNNQNFIHMYINIADSNSSFYNTFIYGNPYYNERRVLWQKISRLKGHLSQPWSCVGDFNKILCHFEKQGGRKHNQSHIDAFSAVCKRNDLSELRLHGCRFTWSNNRENEHIKEKLNQWLDQSHPNCIIEPHSLNSKHK